jgi:hypothetical protein
MSPSGGPAHPGCPSCGGSLSRRVPGRGFAAEGIEELIAEGVHGLERSAGSRHPAFARGSLRVPHLRRLNGGHCASGCVTICCHPPCGTKAHPYVSGVTFGLPRGRTANLLARSHGARSCTPAARSRPAVRCAGRPSISPDRRARPYRRASGLLLPGERPAFLDHESEPPAPLQRPRNLTWASLSGKASIISSRSTTSKQPSAW